MKTGIISVLLGVAGLLVITYFIQEANARYQGAGELQDIVSLTSMESYTWSGLFALEVAGALLGFFAYKRHGIKAGLLGMGLCMLCMILLYGLQ